MAREVLQELCSECLKRETCDYIPTGGKLLRCLDRQTAQESGAVRAGRRADGLPENVSAD